MADSERPEILGEYLRPWKAEVGVFFEGISQDASDEQLFAIAPGYPVFDKNTVTPAEHHVQVVIDVVHTIEHTHGCGQFRSATPDDVRNTGARFQRDEVPDTAALVAGGLAVNAYTRRATIRVEAPLHEVAAEIAPTIGVCRTDPDVVGRTLVEIGGEEEWIARFVVGLPFAFEVLEPASLRDELRRLGKRIAASNAKVRTKP